MDWVPITRDCVVFAANVIVLIGTYIAKSNLLKQKTKTYKKKKKYFNSNDMGWIYPLV